MVQACFQTPLGVATITGDTDGLTAISISENTENFPVEIPETLQNAVTQLQDYFAGQRQQFELQLRLNGTPFQQRVWQELQHIPYGTTISYLQLSRKLGDEKAIRAVAAANGKNPFWVVVPCHRVVGSDGSLTGYAGGLWRKKWLLEHENPSGQTSLF